jgi:hypothetical protein
MQFLECSCIFSGEKGCCRIARVFESGVNFIDSSQHRTLHTSDARLWANRRSHGASGGRMDVDSELSWSLIGGSSRPFEPGPLLCSLVTVAVGSVPG